MDIAKESVKKYTLDDVIKILDPLVTTIAEMQKDIEAIKIKTGARDTPIGLPPKKNYNDDPGPWPQKKAVG